jgi:hypothetical protein
VENEIRLCLAPPEAESGIATARDQLPARAVIRDCIISLWIDTGRFLKNLLKNPSAQARYEQLQRYVGFDVVLKIQPAGSDRLNLTADYIYQTDRFKDRQQMNAMQQLALLGNAQPAGLAGQLMDRCADTLDYDSLIERLRLILGEAKEKGIQNVVVEKSFASERNAQFSLSIHCDPQTELPPAAAVNIPSQ